MPPCDGCLRARAHHVAGVPQGARGARAEGAGARTHRLLGLLADFGEHELVMAGCHENVLNMRSRGAGMVRPPCC